MEYPALTLMDNAPNSKDESKCTTVSARDTHTETDDCDNTSSKYTAPDGGWGWMVCAACFMSHVLTDGIQYSFGVLFVELLDYYKGSKGETAVVASISAGICYLSGPIIAVFTDKFGCRIVTAIGTVIFSGSLILSIFAPNIQFLYFSLGAMFGIGYGMIYLPSIVCVSQHFESKRALATGIGVSGAGIGTFIFSPLTSVLIKSYAWQGAILIQAGLALNCFVCAIVFRPLPIAVGKEKDNNERDLEDANLKVNTVNGYVPCKSDNVKYGKDEESTVIDETCSKSVYIEDVNESEQSVLSKHAFEPLLDDKINSLKDLPYSEDSSGKEKSDGILRNILNNFDVEIFRNVAYCMFLISTLLYSLGYYIPYIYLPDTAKDAGIGEIKASFLVSSVGITNTFGRVLFGFLSDRKWVNRLVLYATALVICGAATCVGPLLTSFPLLLVYTIVFGAFSGVTISLTSVLLSDIVGIDKLAHGLGGSNFFGGIGSLAGPPIAGWLYDVSGNYRMSYIAAGIAIFFSGAMLYFVPFLENKLKSRKLQS